MSTVEFWDELDGMVYRSKAFGDIAEHAFPAAPPFPSPGRLLIRGLYLSIGNPKPWDQVTLWLRVAFSRSGGRRPCSPTA